jgi:hypothetical protein
MRFAYLAGIAASFAGVLALDGRLGTGVRAAAWPARSA